MHTPNIHKCHSFVLTLAFIGALGSGGNRRQLHGDTLLTQLSNRIKTTKAKKILCDPEKKMTELKGKVFSIIFSFRFFLHTKTKSKTVSHKINCKYD